jgi:hypothetical protein
MVLIIATLLGVPLFWKPLAQHSPCLGREGLKRVVSRRLTKSYMSVSCRTGTGQDLSFLDKWRMTATSILDGRRTAINVFVCDQGRLRSTTRGSRPQAQRLDSSIAARTRAFAAHLLTPLASSLLIGTTSRKTTMDSVPKISASALHSRS